jgi:putative redox protein
MRIEVETRNLDGQVTSLGTAEQFSLVVDRPSKGGGGGLGFNGGLLLYLAVAGCISNDLFREARAAGIELSSVRVKVGGDEGAPGRVEADGKLDWLLASDHVDEALHGTVGMGDPPRSCSLRRGRRRDPSRSGYFPSFRYFSNSARGRQLITLPFSTQARLACEMPYFM